MGAAKAYLLLYNVAQSIGWAVALVQSVLAIVRDGSHLNIYAAARPAVRLCQGVAALEILHAATGLVRGSPVAALMQWAGRSNCLFAVVHCIPELWQSPAVASLFIAWSIAEVVRYPWYAASLAGGSPAWLTWARYSAFLVLYPVGVVSEMWLLYAGLPAVRQRQLHSLALPNGWNFAFDYSYFLMGLLVLYPLLWWNMYSYMLRQRQKKLKSE